MNLIRLAVQVAFLWALSWIGTVIVNVLHWHVPGSLLGLIALFLMLQFKLVKVSWVELGASWLLSEMLLFYVPTIVGIVNYGQLIRAEGIRLVILIAISTALVMAITGVVADKLALRRPVDVEQGRELK